MSTKVILCSSSVTILFLLSVLSPVYPQHSGKTDNNPKFNTTSNTELLRLIKGADIKSWMNLKIDPCTNFYEFVCGNWKRIHASKVFVEGSISRYGVLNTEMERKVKKFISNLTTTDVIQSKIQDFYKSCYNTKTSPSMYKSGLLNLSNEFGEFSFRQINEEANVTNPFNWWSAIAKIYKMFGKSMIIDTYVSYHFKTRNKTMIYMGQTSSFLSDEAIDQTKRYFSEIFGASTKDANQLIEDIYRFDDSLSEIITRYTGDFMEEQYSLRNLTDLKEEYKDLFDVESFLKIAFNITEVPEQIYVENCEFFNNLPELLNNTMPKTVENYILWYLMTDFMVDDNSKDIDSVCIDKTKYYFAQYMEHITYQQFRSKELENELFDLWLQITEVVRDNFQSETTYHWMSQATREEAVKKLNNIHLRINSYDDVNFGDFFSSLRISSSNYVYNVRNVMEHFESWRGDKLQIRSESIVDINQAAYTPVYYYESNTIGIPVSTFLPFHVWHPVYPKSILYSDIGNTLAHELFHAFDDSNRQFDAVGNANMWWDDNAIKVYNEKRHCFQAQYQQYILTGHQVRNMTDQSENISDNAAVQVAFSAYIRWLGKRNASETIASELFRNLPYNSEELYFINFGQSNCEAIARQTLIRVMEDETHAPDVLRVLVPLSNYAKFSEVFKCPPNAAMNAKNKCELY